MTNKKLNFNNIANQTKGTRSANDHVSSKMTKKKFFGAAAIFTTMTFAASACGQSTSSNQASDETTSQDSQTSTETVDVSSQTNAAGAGAYTVASVDTQNIDATITLSDNNIQTSGSGVEVSSDQDKVTITASGTYEITGTISDGRIVVEAGTADVVIILNGVNITCDEKDAIFVKEAGSATIYIADGTQNTLTSGTQATYETAKETVEEANATSSSQTINQDTTADATSADNTTADAASADNTTADAASPDNTAADATSTDNTTADASESSSEEGIDNNQKAAIMAKCDLTITGTGSLTVNGYINNGIQSKTNLTIDSANITVTSANDAIKAGEAMIIGSGTFTVNSLGDAFQSDGSLDVYDGTFTITTGDGAASATKKTESFGPGMGGGQGGFPFGDRNQSADGDSNASTADGSGTADSNGQASDMSNMQAPPSDGQAPDFSNAGTSDGSAPDFSNMQAPPSDGQMPSNAQNSDGSSTDSSSSQNFGPGMGGGRGMMAQMFGDDADSADSDSNSVSQKGLKAATTLTVNGGTFTFDTVDDSIHAGGTTLINAGSFTIASGDDAIHSDTDLTVSGGTINVTDCYEGLEGATITITAGDIDIVSDDDGMNAASDTDTPLITIDGGDIYVDAEGDGLDSNGDLVINGGTVYVDGPSNGGNAAIDIGTESGGIFTINGGTVTAVGMSSMLENADSTSTQQSLTVVFDDTLEAGTTVTITDDAGKEIASYTTAKSSNCVTFSSADLESGKTYTFTYGDTSKDLTADDINATNYEGGMGMGGPGGMGGRGNFGGNRDGQTSQQNQDGSQNANTSTSNDQSQNASTAQ